MSATIVVSFNSNWQSPGFAVTLSSITGSPDSVTVTRVDQGGTLDDEIVRGADLAPVGGSTFVTNDYEVPFGYTFQYTAEFFDSGGSSLYSTTSGDVTLPTPSDKVTYGTFLKVIHDATYNRNVLVNGADDITYDSRVLTKVDVLGRVDPIIVTDVLSSRSGSFDLIAIQTPYHNFTVSDYMRALTLNDVLLLQSIYTDEWDDLYFRITGDISKKRLTQQGFAEDKRAYIITVPFTEVARPTTSLGAVIFVISWQDVVDGYATWTAVNSAFTDWYELLTSQG